jgi:hypothetical protein
MVDDVSRELAEAIAKVLPEAPDGFAMRAASLVLRLASAEGMGTTYEQLVEIAKRGGRVRWAASGIVERLNTTKKGEGVFATHRIKPHDAPGMFACVEVPSLPNSAPAEPVAERSPQ